MKLCPQTISLWLVVGCVAMLVFGTTSVLLKNWQVKLGFYEPFLWTWVTFVGQSFFLPIYWGTPRTASDVEAAATKPPAPFHVLALGTFLGFTSLCLGNCAYGGLPGSILNMLKSGRLLVTALLSVTFLGKHIRAHQYLGIAMVLAGAVIVTCVASLGEGVGYASIAKARVGLIFAFGSCIGGGMQSVWEEATMKQYAVPPQLLTGIEGVAGVFYGIIALVVVNLMQVENTPAAFDLLWHSKFILCAFVLFFLTVAMYNYTGIVLTKSSSAMGRTFLDIVKTGCIWVVEVLCHWSTFTWLELLGWVVIVSGTMVCSKIMELPCLTYEEAQPLLPTKQVGSKECDVTCTRLQSERLGPNQK